MSIELQADPIAKSVDMPCVDARVNMVTILTAKDSTLEVRIFPVPNFVEAVKILPRLILRREIGRNSRCLLS